jgi:hypothetical protein
MFLGRRLAGVSGCAAQWLGLERSARGASGELKGCFRPGRHRVPRLQEPYSKGIQLFDSFGMTFKTGDTFPIN